MASNETELMEILAQSGCTALLDRFRAERVDSKVILNMADDDMIKLGVATIGDRIRLRESAKQYMSRNLSKGSSGTCIASTSVLFPGFRGTCTSRNTGRHSVRTVGNRKQNGWTAMFFCLSSSSQIKTPNTVEKEVLNKCGLGLKKIRLHNTMSEEDVLSLLESPDGFSKLKSCGGFELLRTLSNGRHLTCIPSPWTAKDLKLNVGPQARIFIRPIQHDIETVPVQSETEPSVKVTCEKCAIQFSVHDLREHINSCGIEHYENITAHQSSEINQTLDNNQQYELTPVLTVSQSNESNTTGDTEQFHQPSSAATEYVVFYEQVVPPDIPENKVEPEQEFPDLPTEELPDLPTEELPDLQTDENPANEHEPDLSEVVSNIIRYCKDRNISNPVEMLRKIQQEIVLGRSLEIEDPDTSIEGKTTFITVNRDNILATSLEEISELTPYELRHTLEVQFYNEVAVDYGGPRKEFFRLVLQEIKEKYFDNGIRDLLQEDYYQIGIILALSILQNGKMPVFLKPELVQEVFDVEEPKSSAIFYLRQGLNTLGLFDLFVGLPELKFLIQPSNVPLTMKRLTNMLQPKFSEEGSNANHYEKEVYQMFIKYLRELSAGRRGNITLGSVLIFVTSTDEEPSLGFKLPPTLAFEEVEEKKFIPKASTCINQLKLPRGNGTVPLPSQEILFSLYDYAFSNTNYGLA